MCVFRTVRHFARNKLIDWLLVGWLIDNLIHKMQRSWFRVHLWQIIQVDIYGPGSDEFLLKVQNATAGPPWNVDDPPIVCLCISLPNVVALNVFSGVCLFVGLFVWQHDNFRTSKHRMTKLGGRCIVQKSSPSSNLGVTAPWVRTHKNVAFGYVVPKISAGCLVFSGAVDKTSSSFSAHGKIGNFIIIIILCFLHVPAVLC